MASHKKKKRVTARLQAALAAHAGFELSGDLDGTMGTVADDPRYEWLLADHAYIIQGRAAVRAFYERMFNGVIAFVMACGVSEPKILFGETHVVIESLHRVEGISGSRLVRQMAVVEFEGGKVKAERVAIADPTLAKSIAALLGPIERIPGITLNA